MSHDASPTWSGFNYQGKVALYHTLKYIDEKLAADSSFDFSEYSLIVENHEDFDIKGPGGFLSFHQVKAINDTKFSTYENAILAMILQISSDEFKDVIGYLHTWKNIELDAGASFREKAKNIISDIVREYENSDKKEETYLGKASKKKLAGRPKRSAIIRKCFADDKGDLSEEAVVEALKGIVSDGDSVLSRVLQYDYSKDECYCCINDVGGKVQYYISRIIDKKQLARSEEVIDRIYNSLLALIDRHVIDRHNSIGKNVPIPILFDEIIESVTTDKVNSISNEYVAHRFKLQFVSAFESFVNDADLFSDEEYQDFNNGEPLNIDVVSNVLLKVSAVELWEYYRSFSPHLKLNEKDNIDNLINVHIEGVRSSLFRIFNELNNKKINNDSIKGKVLYRANDTLYLPTTIVSGTPSKLAKDILDNPLMIEMLFEVPLLISANSAPKIYDFEEAYNKCRDVDIDDYYLDFPVIKKEKITERIQDLSLVSLDEVKEDINND
jgi:hypothetical protein